MKLSKLILASYIKTILEKKNLPQEQLNKKLYNSSFIDYLYGMEDHSCVNREDVDKVYDELNNIFNEFIKTLPQVTANTFYVHKSDDIYIYVERVENERVDYIIINKQAWNPIRRDFVGIKKAFFIPLYYQTVDSIPTKLKDMLANYKSKLNNDQSIINNQLEIIEFIERING